MTVSVRNGVMRHHAKMRTERKKQKKIHSNTTGIFSTIKLTCIGLDFDNIQNTKVLSKY